MTLDDFYDARNIADDDRIKAPKNVLVITPSSDYDATWFAQTCGVDPYEVAVTWPKADVRLMEEVAVCGAKLIVQLGEKQSRRFKFAADAESVTDEMRQHAHQLSNDAYVNLHHHDEYSIKDGLGTVKQLTKLLHRQRRSFCAVTNHGSIGGWIKQHNACRKAGVKPLFGCEMYVSDYRGDDPIQKKAHRSANHLVLLARNQTGFENIIRIHNDAQLNGFYYSPRMDHAAAKKWGEGIIASSACLSGELSVALMNDDESEALRIYEHYSTCFDEFYVELQIIEYEPQREANRRLIQFARKVGAPIVLCCDSHYLDPTHADTHDLLMCIRQGKTTFEATEKDEDVWDFDVRNLFYRNAEQMEDVFRNGFVDHAGVARDAFEDDIFTEEVFYEAMANTISIARWVDDIQLDSEVKLPQLYDDSETMLRKKANAGFKALGLNNRPNKEEYVARLRHEYDVITKLGWADYFLVMEKIISTAKEEFYDEVGEWVIGFGRGSAAGSLVSWCLGLTDCDPIEHGLLFERFIDAGRTEDPPDIDTDFHPAIRQRVKDRIVEMFGESKTCSIGTYSTYKTRAVILDVARALGYDVGEANAVTKTIDSLKKFETAEGDEEIVDKMSFDELCEHYPELKDYFERYPDVYTHAEILRNQVRNMGKHAGGVIISDIDLTDKIPVQSDGAGGSISSWAESGDAAELSAVGFVKYDILGLNNLPVISDCVKLVKENRGIEIKRSEIPVNDRKAIKGECKGDLRGIFQFENPATKPIVDDVGVESLSDVSAVTSLLRPGPKDMGMHQEYAERKKGKEFDVLPCLKQVFDDTYGIMVYQEQIMQVSQVLCGFDGPMSNRLRKACGKKKKDLMASIKEEFIAGAQPRIDAGEVTKEQVEVFWRRIVTFARYGFNRSHAVTYSMISTAEMWLKQNYFIEYMTALARNTNRKAQKHGSSNVLADYLNYARKQGVEVLPPNVNAPKPDFHIDSDAIRYGLAHIKNVASAAQAIAAIAAEKPFESMADFHGRCEYERTVKSGPNAGTKKMTRPNKQAVESLVYAGAFDRFGDRNQVLDAYYTVKMGIPQPSDDEIKAERECVLKDPDAEVDINDPNCDLTVVKGVGAAGEAISTIVADQPFESMADFHERCVYQREIKSGKNKGDIKKARPTKKVVHALIYAGAFEAFGDARAVLRSYYMAKEKYTPPSLSEQELEELEVQHLGLCLSKEPIRSRYKAKMDEEGWEPLDAAYTDKKHVTVFGRVDKIKPKTSSAGNPMLIVTMSDGMDEIDFFVFKAAMDDVRDNVKAGQLAAMPLDRFEDTGTRFFDDRREITIEE